MDADAARAEGVLLEESRVSVADARGAIDGARGQPPRAPARCRSLAEGKKLPLTACCGGRRCVPLVVPYDDGRKAGTARRPLERAAILDGLRGAARRVHGGRLDQLRTPLARLLSLLETGDASR